ncbi:MAG: hypothetical protein EOO06_11320 [Chitinophagaceae bacterium]|nr:MAG: hypothetical protein EOO06_11320 [Chitinophagaceae bacterium]
MRSCQLPLVAIGCIIIFLNCNYNKPKPSAEDITAMGLKRGNIIECGGPAAGFGVTTFEISCKQVQQDFDLAMAMLHSFEYDEAEKVFAGIIDKAPECSMAYWGVAMCNYHPLWAPPDKTELAKGAKAMQVAKMLPTASPREKAYLDAMAAFYENWEKKDHRSRSVLYNKAMERLHTKFPEDKEGAVLYALSLDAVADPSDKSFANQKKAYRILTGLYPGQASHPGIVHYIIHSYDYPGLAAEALEAARGYAAIAPASAHAQHMPSHIFTRLGLWEESIKSNLKAAEAARCYAQGTGLKAHWDEELHMIDYLTYAYLQLGDNVAAKEQWDYLKTIVDVKPYNFKVSYAFAAVPARYVLENKQWKEAANLSTHITEDRWIGFPWQKAILHYARALGAARIGDIALATREADILEALHDSLLQQQDPYRAKQVQVQLLTAKAWTYFAKQKNDTAIKMMSSAAALEDETEKHPVTPGEVLPARELLADMWMEMKNPPRALDAYKATLKKRPNRFNALYGAGLAARLSGNKAAADTFYHLLITVAKGDRKELREARAYLAGSGTVQARP